MKYGTIFDQLKVDSYSSLVTNILFMVRRLCLSALLIFLDWQPLFQIVGYMLMTIIWIFHVTYYKVFISKEQNRIEITNEVFNMLISYTFLLYTDFVVDLEVRYKIGSITITLIVALIAVNIYSMVKVQIVS